MARPKSRSITVAQQALALCGGYPSAQRPAVHSGRLSWIVALQPTPLSVVYTVGVDYEHPFRIRIKVLDPPLTHPSGKPLPHVYPGDELCLYYRDEFDGRKDFIADKIVPWISEWLYYYELWLTVGEWLGGGVHPELASVDGSSLRAEHSRRARDESAARMGRRRRDRRYTHR